MVLREPQKTTETETNDTEMSWKCDSKEEKRKYN